MYGFQEAEDTGRDSTLTVVPTKRPYPRATCPQKPAGKPVPDHGFEDESSECRGSGPRLAAIKQSAGALTGFYGPGELASLREDWPA